MKELLMKFKNQKIAVIGDLILDKYIYGEVDRISPEAPVPIVRVSKEKYVPGGAANVAVNISTLGGKSFLFGIVGDDQYNDILLQKIKEINIPTSGILVDSNKTTTRKTRVIGLNQQLLRIDHESTNYIETHQEEKLINKIKTINNLSAILISDYAKGTITKKLMLQLIQFSKENNIFLIIDPKPKHKDWYTGSTLITPNKKEAQEMSGIIIESEDDFIRAGKELVNKFDSNVIITAGAGGMYIFERSKEPQHIPTAAKEVYDVSGAGDTVAAAMSISISAGATLIQAAELANRAAGIKVGKSGTAPVFLEELMKKVQEKPQK